VIPIIPKRNDGFLLVAMSVDRRILVVVHVADSAEDGAKAVKNKPQIQRR
jgi:hypothetical protein